MRPLTLLALLLSLVWWQSPPYLRDYWWHTLVYYLTGEWLAQVQHVAQVWKWIPAHCNLTMAWQQLSFMQLPFLVGWGARTLGQRASRASVDWLLRLLCLCAGLHLMALFSMFYKSYLACPEGRHGGACKTTIDDGVGSLVVLVRWNESDNCAQLPPTSFSTSLTSAPSFPMLCLCDFRSGGWTRSGCAC